MSKRKTIVPTAGNIKVCIRLRPFLPREHGEICCVQMPNDTQVVVDGGDVMVDKRHFDYDRVYWSHDSSNPRCATQQTLMDELGQAILDNAMDGFNNTLFAYGQTGSGKTHSVLGEYDPPENRGLLPRILQDLFRRVGEQKSEAVEFQCHVSYLEIYNEQIRDLLIPMTEKPPKLTVRHHPKLGIYVAGLTTNAVTSYSDVQGILDFGTKARSVAATNMNSASSRSHCIFNFTLLKREGSHEQRASVNLVDLAGSERQKKTGASGSQLKEGAMINQSLSNLALVINKLASSSDEGKADFVPFRNSKLTHILQDALSGNSKTVMIAAISPALSNYEETLGTLKFAQTCKHVATQAVRNEASSGSIVEDLTAEIARLKEMLEAQSDSRQQQRVSDTDQLKQQLQDAEQLREKMEKDYNAQLREAQVLQECRTQALSDMGLSLAEISGSVGMDKDTPQLVNLSDDASLTGCLVYFLPQGEDTTVGADKSCKIVLTGLGVQPFMCSLRNTENREVVLQLLDATGQPLEAPPAPTRPSASASVGRILVNGKKPKECALPLLHQDRISLGHAVTLRLEVPLEASNRKSMGRQGTVARMDEDLYDLLEQDQDTFGDAQSLMHSVLEHIGKDRTVSLMKQCGEVLPMVQEGNLITAAVRPKDNLEFRMEIGLELLHADEAEPEVLVGLYKKEDEDGDGQPELKALHFYDVDDFSERLEVMRQTYEDFRLGIFPDFSHMGDDPWMVFSHGEIQDLMLHVHNTRDEEVFKREKAEQRLAAAEAKVAELEEELEQEELEQEVEKLRQAEAAAKAQAADLEKQLAAMKSEQAAKEALQKDVDARLTKEREEAREAEAAAKGQVIELEKQLAAMKSDQAAKDQLQKDSDSRLTKEKEESLGAEAAAKAQVLELEKQLAAMRSELTAKEELHKDSDSRRSAELHEELQALRCSTEGAGPLQQKVGALQVERDQLQRQVEDAKKQAAEERAAWEAESGQLLEQLKQFKAQEETSRFQSAMSFLSCAGGRQRRVPADTVP